MNNDLEDPRIKIQTPVAEDEAVMVTTYKATDPESTATYPAIYVDEALGTHL